MFTIIYSIMIAAIISAVLQLEYNPLYLFLFIGSLYIIIGYITIKVYPSGYLYPILALAAKPVSTIKDGFSGRPFPAGKLDYSELQLRDFAEYMNKKSVAFPIYKADRTLLIFSGGMYKYLHFLEPDLNTHNYAEIYDGTINVRISQREYKKYKFELTFDELCNSFADVIKSLFEYHRKDKKYRITTLLQEWAAYEGLFNSEISSGV